MNEGVPLKLLDDNIYSLEPEISKDEAVQRWLKAIVAGPHPSIDKPSEWAKPGGSAVGPFRNNGRVQHRFPTLYRKSQSCHAQIMLTKGQKMRNRVIPSQVENFKPVETCAESPPVRPSASAAETNTGRSVIHEQPEEEAAVDHNATANNNQYPAKARRYVPAATHISTYPGTSTRPQASPQLGKTAAHVTRGPSTQQKNNEITRPRRPETDVSSKLPSPTSHTKKQIPHDKRFDSHLKRNITQLSRNSSSTQTCDGTEIRSRPSTGATARSQGTPSSRSGQSVERGRVNGEGLARWQPAAQTEAQKTGCWIKYPGVKRTTTKTGSTRINSPSPAPRGITSRGRQQGPRVGCWTTSRAIQTTSDLQTKPPIGPSSRTGRTEKRQNEKPGVAASSNSTEKNTQRKQSGPKTVVETKLDRLLLEARERLARSESNSSSDYPKKKREKGTMVGGVKISYDSLSSSRVPKLIRRDNGAPSILVDSAQTSKEEGRDAQLARGSNHKNKKSVPPARTNIHSDSSKTTLASAGSKADSAGARTRRDGQHLTSSAKKRESRSQSRTRCLKCGSIEMTDELDSNTSSVSSCSYRTNSGYSPIRGNRTLSPSSKATGSGLTQDTQQARGTSRESYGRNRTQGGKADMSMARAGHSARVETSYLRDTNCQKPTHDGGSVGARLQNDSRSAHVKHIPDIVSTRAQRLTYLPRQPSRKLPVRHNTGSFWTTNRYKMNLKNESPVERAIRDGSKIPVLKCVSNKKARLGENSKIGSKTARRMGRT